MVLKETDFQHFLICDSVVVSKELIFNSFYFRRVGVYFVMVWWS